MKHLKYSVLLIILAIFTSCSDSDVEGGLISEANLANFSGTIGELQTRVTDNSWDANDAIGIYALKAGQGLSDAAIFNGKYNIQYITTGDGTFVSEGHPIKFPESGNLDFISYYPFQNTIVNYKYNIDVSTQSNLGDIDLLYSNNVKDSSKENKNISLEFKHMLSKLVLNVELGDDIPSLDGLSTSINSVIIDGELALTDGKVTKGSTKKDITPVVNITEDKKKAAITSIIVPGQNLHDVEFVFTLGELNFRWTPTSQLLESSMKYSYSFKLTLDETGAPTLIPVNATISEWIDGYIGEDYIDLIPEKEEAEFITLAELLTMYENSDKDEWTISEPIRVKSVVISDIEGGNSTSKKNGYMQDEDGTGIGFRTSDNHEFNLGDQLIIDLRNAVVSVYANAIQLGFDNANAIVNDTDVAVEPKELTINEILDGNYDGRLVIIKNVQFEEYEGFTYYQGKGSTFDNPLVDTNGATINLNTSKFATFKDDALPKGKGDIVAISTVSWSGPQLVIRNLEDVSGISNDETTRFAPPFITTNIDGIVVAKEAGSHVVAVESNVEWSVTTDASWLTIDPTSGSDDGNITVTAVANTAPEARIAKIAITVPSNDNLLPIIVTITQKGTNDGTKEKPYTVSEAITLQGEKDVWVEGYIVGSYVNNKPVFSGDGASTSNIMLANDKDEIDEDNVVPVQLSGGSAARTDLNLDGNPDKYKKRVIIKGDLEAYFSTPGLKNAKEYELVTGGGTPDPIIFTADKSEVELSAETELTATVKLTTDAAQAWTVASDAAWLTVAPASGSGNGDIVLTAQAYTEETARTANVTITPTDNTDLTPIVVTVTQNGKPAAGGDFATDLFFSEYVEGGGFNKFLEIYNGTGEAVDLSDYKVETYMNGDDTTDKVLELSGTLEHGEVFVIYHSDATIDPKTTNAITDNNIANFNGDDAVALQKISTGEYVDIIGRIGERPDKKWSAGGDLETLDKTLVRKPSVKGGVTVNPTEGFPTLATEWIGYPKDTAEHLGSHTTDY